MFRGETGLDEGASGYADWRHATLPTPPYLTFITSTRGSGEAKARWECQNQRLHRSDQSIDDVLNDADAILCHLREVAGRRLPHVAHALAEKADLFAAKNVEVQDLGQVVPLPQASSLPASPAHP